MMHAWEEHVKDRYDPARDKQEFRRFTPDAPPGVIDFYRQNHAQQTRAFVLDKKRQYLGFTKTRMGIWEAMEFLNTLVDDSDPDTDLSQIEHNLQTAEAARRDGRPEWFVLAGLIHDLGKVLCLWNEPQWAVVGDTFVTGCAWPDKIVYPEFFAANPDAKIPEYQTPLGVYKANCGLDSVDLSWGHDEYLYHVTKPYLPIEAQYMIRYHSFYPWHREGAYEHLTNEQDRTLMSWVKEFNQYDLYSKSDSRVDVEAVRPYYDRLIRAYFPETIAW